MLIFLITTSRNWKSSHYTKAFLSLQGRSMKSDHIKTVVRLLFEKLYRDQHSLNFSILEISETFNACSQIWPISNQDKDILKQINNILMTHSILALD